MQMRFNTVNGKHCCNWNNADLDDMALQRFNTVNGKHCCNEERII